MLSAQHSKSFEGHSSPPNLIGCVSATFPNGFMDAATSQLSQQLIVKASSAYSPPLNGLDLPWGEFTYVNPPGGGMRSWFVKALEEWSNGNCREIIFLGFQTSVLRLNQEIYSFGLPHISPSSRLKFWSEPRRLLRNAVATKNDKDKSQDVLNLFMKEVSADLDWVETDAPELVKLLIALGMENPKSDKIVQVANFVKRKAVEG